MVDEPFKEPNCCGSILFLTSEIIHLTTKSSRTLERHAVSDIGLVSASSVGCLILPEFLCYGRDRFILIHKTLKLNNHRR